MGGARVCAELGIFGPRHSQIMLGPSLGPSRIWECECDFGSLFLLSKRREEIFLEKFRPILYPGTLGSKARIFAIILEVIRRRIY